MGDLLFIIKCVALTFVFVLLMQIKIGPLTLEERAIQWTRESAIVAPIREAADGGVVAIRQAWQTVSQSVSSKFNSSLKSENWPGQRTIGIQLERSKAVVEEQARKAQSKAKSVWRDWRQDDSTVESLDGQENE